MSNVIYGGFRSKRRKKDDHKNKILRCGLSERWIQLPPVTELTGDNIDWMHLDVMTNGNNDKPRKLCQMMVNRTELIELIKEIPIVDHRGSENE